ncbi:MAG: SBBP repeat-containing protein, partial [Anaerolineales bacterium]|nr:SBBP repeat-containing protein [Anaerolineales bacterium]
MFSNRRRATNRQRGKIFVLILGIIFLLLATWVIDSQAAGIGDKQRDSTDGDGVVALPFLQNIGQVHPDVRFYARTAGASLYLDSNGFFLGLASTEPSVSQSASTVDIIPLHIRYLELNPGLRLEGQGPTGASMNEYLGSNRESWREGVPAFREVVYRQLYPGVDLSITGVRPFPPGLMGIKATYHLVPWADPDRIRWEYSAEWDFRETANGDLLLRYLPRGSSVTLLETAPIAWQLDRSGSRIEVPVEFRLHADGTVGFDVGPYDRSLPLVIDPELEFSTFFGGSGTDEGFDVTVDGARNPIVVGATLSVDYPTDLPPGEEIIGTRNVVLSKLSNDGQRVEFSTFLGGAGDDLGRTVAVDSTGEIYLAGSTDSDDFPTSLPAVLPE